MLAIYVSCGYLMLSSLLQCIQVLLTLIVDMKLQGTHIEMLVNWSTKGEVKQWTFWKVAFARSLITTSGVDVVGLHIFLSNTNSSASLRDDVVYGLYFIFDPGGILIGPANQVVGLPFQKLQHLNFFHKNTWSFTGSSFFPIPSWSPAYGSKCSSNDVPIVLLLVERLALYLLHT